MMKKIMMLVFVLFLVGCKAESPNTLTVTDTDAQGNIIQQKTIDLDLIVGSQSVLGQTQFATIQDTLIVDYLPDIPANVAERTFTFSIVNTGNVHINVNIEKAQLEVR